MKINLIRASYFKTLECNRKVKLLQAVRHECEQNRGKVWTHFTGFLAAPAMGALSITSIVATFCENLFKGMINCAGSVYFRECSFKRGCKQLFIGTSKNVLWMPFELVAASLECIGISCLIALEPLRYSIDYWHCYKKKEEDLINIYENIDRGLYNVQIAANHIERWWSLQTLAMNYETGRGVSVNIKRAMYYYEQAANSGCGFSMIKLANLHLTTNKQKAIYWFNKALLAGERSAIDKLKDLIPQRVLSDDEQIEFDQFKQQIFRDLETKSKQDIIDEMRTQYENNPTVALEFFLAVLLNVYLSCKKDEFEPEKFLSKTVKNGLINQYNSIVSHVHDHYPSENEFDRLQWNTNDLRFQ